MSVDGAPALRPGLAVVVTGGTRGTGAAVARAFLAAGSRVLVCGRTAPASPAQLPSARGRSAVYCQADVRDPDQASRLVRTAADLFGRLDVVVSNAGGSPQVAASAASARFHQAIIELNLTAPLIVAQSANAIMQSQDSGGVVVMAGSASALRPSPGTAAFGAAKAGLHHLVTSLAVEWAPKVAVYCVAPGMADTAAADVAAACTGLASPAAPHPSGSVLVLHEPGEPPEFVPAGSARRT